MPDRLLRETSRIILEQSEKFVLVWLEKDLVGELRKIMNIA